MDEPLQTVAETDGFIGDCDEAGVDGQQRLAIVKMIARDPKQGDLVKNSGGVRKVRVAGRGKGKSGGYRVMTAYLSADRPVYLLALLSKGDAGNFDDEDIAEMKKFMTELKAAKSKRKD
jgi:hypothetical protein